MSGGEYKSAHRNRVYVRKFDWDEAKRLREQGWYLHEIATHLGVTKNAVQLALSPRLRAQNRNYQREWHARGRCEQCGEPCTRTRGRITGLMLCRPCANDVKNEGKRVKIDEAGRLLAHCQRCGAWKPFDGFANARRDRWGIRKRCRSCDSVDKREWRDRNKVPCSHGCGAMVDGKNRRTPDKPAECAPCSLRRIKAEQAAA